MRRGPLNTPANRTVADLGERAIIEIIRSRTPPSPAWVRLGIGDDAAVVAPERNTVEVLTTDSLVEGVHFDRRFSAPYDIGWKALAVNLSDVASMGAAPRAALLSLGLPGELPAADFDALIDGFLALAARERVALVGGNVTRSPGPLFVDVTLTGAVHPRRVLTRAGARPGDIVYVTGSVGDAAAGLVSLRAGEDVPDLADRHRRPDPRCRAGLLLGRNGAASSCMDLSDGLADAVSQVAAASGVGMTIDADALPVSSVAREVFERAGLDALTAAIAGGDDYELLFTAPARRRGRLETARRQARGLAFTRIGVVTRERHVLLARNGATEPLPEGFVHFR